jgi:protein archease
MNAGRAQPDLSGESGFRILPHTADCIIEAWGPDRLACLTQAVAALVSVFAEVGDAVVTTTLPVSMDPAPPADLLVGLLEEVIYVVEVFDQVPVHVHLAEGEDGGLAGDFEVVRAADVALVGPVPKGVSYHDLAIADGGGGWRCRVVVDL